MEKKNAGFKAPTFSVPSKAKTGITPSFVKKNQKNPKQSAEQEKPTEPRTDIPEIGKQKTQEFENKSLKKVKKLKRDADKPICPQKEKAVILPVNGSGDFIDTGNKFSEGTDSQSAIGNKPICPKKKEAVIPPANESGDSKDPGKLLSEDGDSTDSHSADCTGDNTEPIKKKEQLIKKNTTEDHKNTDKAESEKETNKAQTSLGKRSYEDSSCGKETKIKQKKPTLPVRSLTDEEYESIFAAAIEKALNLDMNEWTPKCTSPKKVSQLKRKKYKITVGKPVDSFKKSGKENAKPKFQINKVKKHNKSESHTMKTNEAVNVHLPEEQKVKSEGNVNKSVDAKSDGKEDNRHNDADNGMEVDSDVSDYEADVPSPEAPVKNETTPAGSRAESASPTPPKKKVKKAFKGVKNPKLEPRQLPFESEEVQVNQKKEKLIIKSNIVKKHDSKFIEKKVDQKKLQPNREKQPMKAERERKVSKNVKKDRKMEMLSREINLEGTWVQCCKTDCMKWRYLPTVSDPSKVPEYWTCSMNTKEEYNSCDKAEETYDESEHIYTKYCEGSIVWAKIAGYPWWPAMIEIDPDTANYFKLHEKHTMVPTHYHCVFLDDKISRVWVKVSQLKLFDRNDERCIFNEKFKSKKKGSSIEKEINTAKKNAMAALDYQLKERIKIFGFAAKFKGQWGKECSHDQYWYDKAKEVKKEKIEVKEEIIDDTTMDDVLDNTEALLSNVEEMLDSLDSPLDDSDEDSNFSVDEMICVEGRKKGMSNERRNRQKKLSQTYSDSSDDENMMCDLDEQCTIEITMLDEDGISEENGVEDCLPNAVKDNKLTLDREIFTMELDDDDIYETIEKERNENLDVKNKVPTKLSKIVQKDTNCDLKRADNMVSEMKVEDSKKEKKRSSQKKIDNSGIECLNSQSVKLNDLNGNEEKVKTNKMKAKSDNKTTKKPLKPSLFNKKEEMTENINMETDAKNDKEKDTNLDKSKDDSCDSVVACKENLDSNVAIKEKAEVTEDQSNNRNDENNQLEKDNVEYTGDDSLLPDVNDPSDNHNNLNDQLEADVNNQNINHNSVNNQLTEDEDLVETSSADSLLPDVNENLEKNLNHSTQEGISLEEESEVDFDFGEHSMYDSNIGAGKIAERAVMVEITENSVIPVDQEDSDPFDMIEE